MTNLFLWNSIAVSQFKPIGVLLLCSLGKALRCMGKKEIIKWTEYNHYKCLNRLCGDNCLTL